MSDSIVDALFLLNSEMSLRWMITLLHFLWQGCVIGLMATAVSLLLKSCEASLRYWLHAIAMLACPVCVAVTFSLVTVPESLLGNRGVEIDPAVAFEFSTGGVLPADVPYPVFTPAVSITQPPVSRETVPSTSGAVAARVVNSPTIAEVTPFDVNADWYRMIAMWAMVAYLIGVVCFLLRLSVALWGGHRLRATSVPLADSALLSLVRDQAQRIGLRLVPVVAYCERVAVPTVIGVLRPIVLLPASIVTGLTVEEFAAIISHEFAHIRRYDLWMNLLQRLIESLLFFHPVVWFLSRRLSAEREVCCDDLVVRSGHEAMNYAGALLRMAELCAIPRHQNAAALTATGRSMSLLEHRISRLIWLRPTPKFQLTRLGLLAVLFGFIALCTIPTVAMLQLGDTSHVGSSATTLFAVSSQPANVDEKKADADDSNQARQTAPGSADTETSERTEPISISGTVFDDNGDPLPGARVYVVSSSSGAFRKLADTFSDADGNYHFKDIALPIVTEKRYEAPRDVFGAFEVFATDESLGFTWRSSKSVYPDSPPFSSVGIDDNPARPQRDSGYPVLDSPSGFFRNDQIKMDLAFDAPKRVRLRVVDDEGIPLANSRVRLWNADPIPGVARELIGGNMVVNGMGFRMLYESSLMPDDLVKRTTDADGWFEFAAMPCDCEFRIQVAPEGSAERMIYVTTGENYTSEYEVLYSDGQELIFPRIQAVKVTVTFADTLKPAPHVWVHGGSWDGDGSSHGSTDDAGQITLKLPPGDCKFVVLPEYKTPYVFVDDDSLQMTVERDKENVFQIQLELAAEVEVLAVDATSGEPVAGADLWTILPDEQGKKSHEWRSFEQPNVVHQGSKSTDGDGRIETYFRPGTHAIGLCKVYTPVGYQPMSFKDAVTIECKAGEKQTVTLKLNRN